MLSQTRKNLFFYLPKKYKAQLNKIAKRKGITFTKLVMDALYQEFLTPEPEEMTVTEPKEAKISPEKEERTDSELAIAVRIQAETINKLMAYIEENISRKEL